MTRRRCARMGLHALPALAGVLALAGCAHVTHVPGTVIDRPEEARGRMVEVRSVYPPVFRGLQRGLLTMPHQQVALTGVVIADDEEIKLVALGEFQKTLFALTLRPDGTATVDKAVSGLPMDRLAPLVARDLREMFRSPDRPILRQERTVDGLFRVVASGENGEIWAYDFDEARGGCLVRTRRVRGDRVCYEMRFEDHMGQSGPSSGVPRVTRIDDYDRRYSVVIRLGQYTPGE